MLHFEKTVINFKNYDALSTHSKNPLFQGGEEAFYTEEWKNAC
jgi:hypothetical protein